MNPLNRTRAFIYDSPFALETTHLFCDVLRLILTMAILLQDLVITGPTLPSADSTLRNAWNSRVPSLLTTIFLVNFSPSSPASSRSRLMFCSTAEDTLRRPKRRVPEIGRGELMGRLKFRSKGTEITVCFLRSGGKLDERAYGRD